MTLSASAVESCTLVPVISQSLQTGIKGGDGLLHDNLLSRIISASIKPAVKELITAARLVYSV